MKEKKCGGDGSWGVDLSKINDAGLVNAVRTHMEPEFWKNYPGSKRARLQLWAMKVRREARSRGLI